MSEAKILPRRLSFSKICSVLIGYLNAGADKNFVGVSEVANKTEVTLHNISRNNNFFKSWGFIEESEEEPGKYKLTSKAAEFISAYRIDPNGDLTKQLLRKVLEQDDLLTKLVERIKREKMDRRSLIVELPSLFGDLRVDKVGLNAFVDMIGYAFQLKELLGEQKVKVITKRARQPEKIKKKPKLSQKILEIPSTGINLTVNLTINSEMSPVKLKEYIKAILRAYDEYVAEKSSITKKD